MPADAVAALVDRDPALPGLAVLLDDEALARWWGGPVRRTYLRYKPGRSCVLAGRTTAGPFVVTARARDATGKLRKDLSRVPGGALLAHDRELRLLATTPAGDRRLPALAALADDRRRARVLGRLTGVPLDERPVTLSWKPRRRWVGRVGDVVLRAYSGDESHRALRALEALHRSGAAVPVVVGHDARLGLLAVEHVPGRPPSTCELSRVGAELARLHASTASLPAAHDVGAAVRASARQVARLLPELAPRAGRLARAVCAVLAALRDEPVVAHGDFSTDQVVVRPDGAIVLIDLDRAGTGSAAGDLAGAAAAELGPRGGDVLAGLLDGYAGLRRPPAAAALGAHLVAHHLRRAPEPFRQCASGWPSQVEARLAAAEAAL